jgi:dihydropteroate synthase-like protein
LNPLTREKIHFVTGKLAESAVRSIVDKLSAQIGFDYSLQVMPITVAALMTAKWCLRHLDIPDGTTRVILPGYLREEIDTIQKAVGANVECGPRDIRELPKHFGKKITVADDYGRHTIEILAEINYAPRMSLDALRDEARKLKASGADLIDLGCDPGFRWNQVADAVCALADEGIRCSIDTFDPWEAEQATRAGAELVLSVNGSNRDAARDWGCEVVLVPDSTDEQTYLRSLEQSIDFLVNHQVRFRIDPILEPIGCGFAASLLRYQAVRSHFPEAPMLMGIGNLTELTDCDSAGINILLLALCEEWSIYSVLTTQVIHWAQTSVRECDLARKLVAYANRHRIPAKRVDDRLVMLRDPKVLRFDRQSIELMTASIKDNNYRVFIADGLLHLVAAGVHIEGTDPFAMMDELMKLPQSRNVDSNHAFYLGFELHKALTALTLGKNYDQDVALHWGFLTREESHRRLKRNP